MVETPVNEDHSLQVFKFWEANIRIIACVHPLFPRDADSYLRLLYHRSVVCPIAYPKSR